MCGIPASSTLPRVGVEGVGRRAEEKKEKKVAVSKKMRIFAISNMGSAYPVENRQKQVKQSNNNRFRATA